MRHLTIDDLEAVTAEIEDAIDASTGVDPWCSGPDWVLPVHAGFAPTATTLLVDVSDHPTTGVGVSSSAEESPVTGFGLFARYQLADGRAMLAGLEPLWGFAAPIIASDPAVITSRLAEVIAAEAPTDVVVLPGMPVPDGPEAYTSSIVRGLGHLGVVKAGAGITRRVADIGDGYDAWLGRRTPRFRRSLRRIRERAEREGVEVIDVGADPDVFDRILRIEERTWKAEDNGGITSPAMATTYRLMVERLQASGRLRAHIATIGGHDVGYIIGGVRAERYRGLQLSYVAEAAELSVGHLLQDHQLRLLTTAGEASAYDLGMDLDYKRRWADRAVTSLTLVIERGQRDISQ